MSLTVFIKLLYHAMEGMFISHCML